MTEEEIKQARAKAEAGERLTLSDALALYEDNDLLFLAACARKMKEKKSGKNVYYNVNRHINLTNICTSGCPLCAFALMMASRIASGSLPGISCTYQPHAAYLAATSSLVTSPQPVESWIVFES